MKAVKQRPPKVKNFYYSKTMHRIFVIRRILITARRLLHIHW